MGGWAPRGPSAQHEGLEPSEALGGGRVGFFLGGESAEPHVRVEAVRGRRRGWVDAEEDHHQVAALLRLVVRGGWTSRGRGRGGWDPAAAAASGAHAERRDGREGTERRGVVVARAFSSTGE